MIKQIIAIGGGGFGRDPGKGLIEDYILRQSKNKKPNICFIPTATGDNEEYKEKQKIYQANLRVKKSLAKLDK